MAQVQQDQMLQRRSAGPGQNRGNKLRPLAIREMTAIAQVPGDQGGGAWCAALHLDIVVKLHSENIDISHRVGHGIRPAPRVRHIADPDGPFPPGRFHFDSKPERRAVMSKPQGFDTEPIGSQKRPIIVIPDQTRRFDLEEARMSPEVRSVPLMTVEDDVSLGEGMKGAVVDMVAVRMGEHGRRDLIPSRPDARQPLGQSTRSKSKVDEDAASLCANQGGIPLRTAGEYGELHGHVRAFPHSSSARQIPKLARASFAIVYGGHADGTSRAFHGFFQKKTTVSVRGFSRLLVYHLSGLDTAWSFKNATHLSRRPFVPLVFPSSHPVVLEKIAALRSMSTRPSDFRILVRSLASLLAQEATADLPTRPVEVTTPLGTAPGRVLSDTIGIVPILRAGLGMADGVLDLLPSAEVWHIGLFRDEHTLRPVEYYNKLPSKPRVSLALIVDPMLATGGSAVRTCEVLRAAGISRLKFLALIAAPEGIARLSQAMPDVPIHVGVIDERLNDIGFIHPGLGDAGDRQFGTSLN